MKNYVKKIENRINNEMCRGIDMKNLYIWFQCNRTHRENFIGESTPTAYEKNKVQTRFKINLKNRIKKIGRGFNTKNLSTKLQYNRTHREKLKWGGTTLTP